MKLRVRDMDIATGAAQIVILHQDDALSLDLHAEDRLIVKKGRKSTTAILDIAESAKSVPQGQVGVFEEVLDALEAVDGDVIEITLGQKPQSLSIIKKKLDGRELTYAEIKQIVMDITNNELSDIELTSYVIANYAKGMSMQEIIHLTKAMAATGETIRPRAKLVADLHCIGGVPGNRTTMIVVPILVAAGLCVPKTASRAITSPAGTADTMEVLAPVTLTKAKLERILDDVGGFIVWGGAANLVPADDRIIRVEHPLSIDAEGQMLASIMAKKANVSTTHLLMDLPIGPGSKLLGKKEAMCLKRHFIDISKELGIKVLVVISNGSQPIGNGIGPSLEARDCLWLLKNDERGPRDLRTKSLRLAGEMLEFTDHAKKGQGFGMASAILRDGRAYDAMVRMIVAQGGNDIDPEKIPVGDHQAVLRAGGNGTIIKIDNILVARVARLAGAPKNAGSGVFMHVRKGVKVRKGDPLMTIYADGHVALNYAWQEASSKEVFILR